MTSNSVLAQNEIDELEKRLLKMDLKLETAKKARDEYVNFLRQKYPNWEPPKIQLHKQQSNWNDFQRPMIDKLATNKYHWDIGRYFPTFDTKREMENVEPNDPIPLNGGVALEHDLIRMKKRLSEIADDVAKLRDRRIHLSSAEYYLSNKFKFVSTKNNYHHEMPWKKSDTGQNSFHELRKQINQMDTFTLLDTPRPDAEAYERIRMDYLEKYANKAAPEENAEWDAEKCKQPMPVKEGNLSEFSEKQQGKTNNLQQTQCTNENSLRLDGGTCDLRGMIDDAQQRDDQKSSNLEMVVGKSRSTEMSNISQTLDQSNTTDNDGFNFLARILGTSAAVDSNKTTLTNKFTDGNVEDSDSDFFD